MFYLEIIIPIAAKLFLSNPEDYRMLGQYVQRFGDYRGFAQNLKDEGLDSIFANYFYGCATGVYGTKKH